jgi:tripartite-type tricarboxylate transporter receptor subunit TctC
MMKFRHTVLAGFALAMLIQPRAAPAETYPNRTITIVLPLGAGGSMDTIARTIADRLSKRLGQPVIIENKPGGGMVIGARDVANADPDGYTFMIAPSGAYAINPTMYKALPYDPEKDFVPVSLYARIPFVLVVNPAFPAKTVKELVDYAKANPGKVSYAASTLGGVIHLAGVIFNHDAGIKMTMVPYKQGGPAALNDVVAGHVNVTFADPLLAPGMITSGKVRALGVSSTTRMPTLPDVPTVAEAGVPGYEAISWHLMVAPAKTPRDIVDKVHAEMKAIMATPEVQKQMHAMGLVPVDSPSIADMQTFVATENARWGKIVTEAGIAHSK